MLRRTTLATALLGIYAGQAFALGLGNIRMKSYLDQPLDAEIEVLASSPAEIASLRVKLAPPEAYTRAGVERAYFHGKLHFRVERRPGGKTVIHVTSREPVKEPFLDFLVEADWGAGQIVREYTLLVDPPALLPSSPPKVQAPVAAAPRAPAPQAAPRIVSAPVAPMRPPVSTAPGTYGPTRRNETLWSIAEKVRPSRDLSVPQVMMALLRANPQAFYHHNVNNLKAGYVLRIPSIEEMRAMSRAAAAQEFRRQMAEWRSGAARPGARSQVAGAGKPVSEARANAEQGTAAPEARLELLAPDTGKGAKGAAAEGEAAGAGTGSEGERLAQLKKELTLAREAITAQEQQNAQLSERLRRLEDQVQKLHRLLELKDSELARLQRSGAAPTAAAGTPASASPAPETEAKAPSAPETGAAETGTQDQAAAPGPAVAPAPVTSAPVATPAESAPAPSASPSGEQPSGVAGSQPSASASTPPAAGEEKILSDQELGESKGPSLVDRLLTDPVYQAIGGGIVLLLVLLLWMARRNRTAEETVFEESILQEPTAPTAEARAEEASDVSTTAETAGDVREASGPETDSSLFTDFAVSGMDAMREDTEADPLAEADVYLAYGRYQQAEELIRGVVEKQPEDLDLRVKLLEVLYAARDRAGFEAEAEALLERLGDTEDARWQRVVEMGQELAPDNPRFGASATPEAERAQDAETAQPTPEAASSPSVAGEAEAEPGAALEPEVAGEASARPGEAAPEGEAEGAGQEEPILELVPPEETPAAEPAFGEEVMLEPDLTAGVQEEEAPATEEEDGTLAPLDEVATKLDLARAYMEMGDPEGARSILQEVLEEGSREQKEEAETLLRQVG
ncbi:MAG: hypothetical protein D6721_00260 [Gammaproteobacteria bacterium]|nr:MAG: hypothetical protein D6721_00260 [Gammaproteobacteria bacterium]